MEFQKKLPETQKGHRWSHENVPWIPENVLVSRNCSSFLKIIMTPSFPKLCPSLPQMNESFPIYMKSFMLKGIRSLMGDPVSQKCNQVSQKCFSIF